MMRRSAFSTLALVAGLSVAGFGAPSGSNAKAAETGLTGSSLVTKAALKQKSKRQKRAAKANSLRKGHNAQNRRQSRGHYIGPRRVLRFYGHYDTFGRYGAR
ncbi:hypothetical protein [Coralliovum pocilloporae]|uniref:hypothetical protein n=1 Tax=Coralliovum pocilloporae TaxID=3066369 RepID=UPI00330783BA